MPVDIDYSRGRQVGPDAAVGHLPQVDPNARRSMFYLVAHPGTWFLTETGPDDARVKTWLPHVSCKSPKAGLHGAVDGNPLPFLSYLQSKGYVDITRHPDVLSLTDGGAVDVHDMADGGRHWAPAFELIGVRGGKTRKTVDTELLEDIQRAAAKILGGMPEETLEDIQRPKIARLASYRLDRSGGVNIANMIAKLEQEIADGRAAWERDYKQKAVRPAGARRGRKAAAHE